MESASLPNTMEMALFINNVQSYTTIEPAIDLTASTFLAFSCQTAGAPAGIS